MPVVSLICPCTPGELPLDHFESGACGGHEAGQYMPQAWAASIVKDRLADRYHADGRLTVTRLLTCPRETLIADYMDVAFDPRSMNSIHWGTAIHAALERDSENLQYVEIRFGGPDDELPAANLLGVKIAGKIDHITAGFGEIHDYKCHSEMAQKFVGRQMGNQAPQLNLYRMGLMDVMPETKGKLERLIAYHGAMTSAKGPEPWIPETLPIMTEAQILAFRPSGGEASVVDIIRAYLKFNVRQVEGMDLNENLKLVPIYGRSMFNRKKCTSYCQPGVKAACDELEGIPSLI